MQEAWQQAISEGNVNFGRLQIPLYVKFPLKSLTALCKNILENYVKILKLKKCEKT